MKWTKQLDEQLEKLFDLGKTNYEIGIELLLTKDSIRNRCRRLGLKRIYTVEIICINCKSSFLSNKGDKRKFCSNNCSNSYSNKNRKHSDKTKQKMSLSKIGIIMSEETKNKLRGKNNSNWKGGKSLLIKKLKNERLKVLFSGTEKEVQVRLCRLCRFCKEFKIESKCKIICDNCKLNYYKFYRPLCEFNFKLEDYPDKFNLFLLKKHGRYSPSNKGNNLNGISRDHMYSVHDGFINKIEPSIIKHPANCRLLLHVENNKKKTQSSITLEELLERIENW